MKLNDRNFELTLSSYEVNEIVTALNTNLKQVMLDREEDGSYNPDLDKRIRNIKELRNSMASLVGITYYGE